MTAENYELERKMDEGFRRLETKIDRLETKIEGNVEIAEMKVDQLQSDLSRANTTVFINTLMTSIVFGIAIAGVLLIHFIFSYFDDDDD